MLCGGFYLSAATHPPQAARELGVGLTALKKRCRKLGIKRWPFRLVCRRLNNEAGLTLARSRSLSGKVHSIDNMVAGLQPMLDSAGVRVRKVASNKAVIHLHFKLMSKNSGNHRGASITEVSIHHRSKPFDSRRDKEAPPGTVQGEGTPAQSPNT